MRVILQTAPILVMRTIRHKNSGKPMEGTAYFVATVYDPGEAPPLGTKGEPDARLMSYWRSAIGADQPFRVDPPYAGLPPIQIPRSLVDPLPETARLELSWRWAQN